MKQPRRGFLGCGAVLGMAGALLGAGGGKAQASTPQPVRPNHLIPPAALKPENVTLKNVDILPDMQATRYPGYRYDWENPQAEPVLDPAMSYDLRVLIDGAEYGFTVTRSRPVIEPGGQ